MNIQAIVKQVIEELKTEGQVKIGTSPENAEIKPEIAEGRHIVYEIVKQVGVDQPVNREEIGKVQSITPARIGIGRTGTRMKTRNYLDFRIDHAAAQDAVFKDVPEELLKELKLPVLQSKAETMDQYLMDLDSGRRLNETSRKWADKNLPKNRQVQIIVSDGLSSTGIEANIGDLLPALVQGLQSKNISIGDPVFIKRSRVWIQDDVASIVNCDCVISLIGERPGLATAKSISAYLIYKPSENTVEADRTVISNIHEGGVPPVEAGAHLADLIETILKQKASGVKLAKLQ
ncbi:MULTISPECIES: ethanolamine ammonia-lyase subunit EutC [Cytobacillus]|uniref:ethanolamine ammonia-lyase subunit EutC n=1 Tax=Cytobacillus TaxID=2675230 RepID=UPI00204126FB|nr:ethanolamine ammonia-lyase subunit EutC [Cytobacillus firmus]MCM3707540.1 ethanolamine ammonia-lyase subunit EutC [Cytobacillus firmus]